MSFVHFTSPNSGNIIHTLRWPTSIQGFQSVLHTPKAHIHTMWWCVFRQHWHIDQHSTGMIHICATTACLKIIEPCVERIIGQMLHADQLRLYNNHQTSGTQRTNTTVCMKKKTYESMAKSLFTKLLEISELSVFPALLYDGCPACLRILLMRPPC